MKALTWEGKRVVQAEEVRDPVFVFPAKADGCLKVVLRP